MCVCVCGGGGGIKTHATNVVRRAGAVVQDKKSGPETERV